MLYPHSYVHSLFSAISLPLCYSLSSHLRCSLYPPLYVTLSILPLRYSLYPPLYVTLSILPSTLLSLSSPLRYSLYPPLYVTLSILPLRCSPILPSTLLSIPLYVTLYPPLYVTLYPPLYVALSILPSTLLLSIPPSTLLSILPLRYSLSLHLNLSLPWLPLCSSGWVIRGWELGRAAVSRLPMKSSQRPRRPDSSPGKAGASVKELKKKNPHKRHKSAVGSPIIPGPPRINLVGRRIQHVWTDGHVVWKGTVLEQVPVKPSLYLIKYDGFRLCVRLGAAP
uniref:Uncharacterized protein n=1 Tax=Gadus morhua TaxID=8049 RepID=A0A8C5A2Z9_GADMO